MGGPIFLILDSKEFMLARRSLDFVPLLRPGERGGLRSLRPGGILVLVGALLNVSAGLVYTSVLQLPQCSTHSGTTGTVYVVQPAVWGKHWLGRSKSSARGSKPQPHAGHS